MMSVIEAASETRPSAYSAQSPKLQEMKERLFGQSLDPEGVLFLFLEMSFL